MIFDLNTSFGTDFFSADADNYRPPEHSAGLTRAHAWQSVLAEPNAIFSVDANEPSTDSTPRAVLANWHRLRLSQLSERSRSRIEALAARRSGWSGRHSPEMSATSLKHFLEFWAAVHPYASEPKISLLPNGRIHAIWFVNPRNFLDVQFKEDGRVIYGLFYKGAVHEGVSPKATLKNLIETTARGLLKDGG